ncbi:MAG: protein kinase [Calditrichia bacterium]
MSGKTIEHFQILRELGRGGMGIVYLAEDKRLGRKVALKFLTDENLSREKILKEARLASQLQHPGIVTIYDVLENPSGTCIVMEYVEGDSLEHFLKTHRIDIPFALRLARQIIEIVADAHQYNLVHGDLKPSNIIITPQGKPKLLDFGLAGLISTPADTLSISGTFPYIAPEKIIGSPNTEQTDIYALGNILYRLFTGISPFEKSHQSAQIYAIMHDIPRSPNQLNKKLPAILGDIILRCLEKEPKSRYTSAKVLLSDLNAVELSDIREKPGISPKAIWTNLSIFVVIFAVLTFLFIKIQKAPEPVKSIEEISLPKPTRLSIDYKTPNEQDMTTQTRLLGLIEVLQDQLERVSGLDVILKKPVIETTLDTSGTSNNAENSLQIDLVKENDSYKIKYDLSNSDNSRRYNSSLNWKNFDDIFWVSNKLLSGIFKFLIDKKVILKNPPEDIQKNLLTFRYFSHGLYQFKEKYYQFAINNFNEALSINPFFAQAHYYKGLSLFNLQRYRDALKEFYDALPEAGKQNAIDWETQVLSKHDGDKRYITIMTRKNNNLVPSGLYLFHKRSDNIFQLVNSGSQLLS